MPLEVNLQKSTQTLQLCLQKAGIDTPPCVELAFAIDVSGSFRDEHEEGVTNDLMTRLVPWGMTFDPDKKLDVFTFSDGPESAVAVGAIDAKNHRNFVRNKIIGKVNGWCGGTDYSYVIEATLRSFGWLSEERKGGFLSRLFGAKPTPDDTPVKAKKRSLVLFVTDGENFDQKRTRNVLKESSAREDDVYFLFIGVSNQGSNFSFLEKIGDDFPNTGFYEIKNLRQFVQESDESLNEKLISKELLNWFKN